MSAGIDYSLGRANFDPENGVHYGVISQHFLMPEALGDIEPVYLDCKDCDDRRKCPLRKRGDYCDAEPIGLEYIDDEYYIVDCLDSDLMILKSPYVTRAQFCSPCVPGAGNLDYPDPGGPLTYCLGPDWFEDSRAPYDYQTVQDALQLERFERIKKGIS